MDESGGSTVVITGAAGSIGRATAARFVARGATCIGWDQAVTQAPFDGTIVGCDLLDEGQVEAAARQARRAAVRHVVAVAGGGDLDELTADGIATESLATFRRVVDTNLTTAFLTVKHLAPHLAAAGTPTSVTLVSSINAHGGYGAPGYSAAKAGLVGLAKSLAAPLGRDGIRINVLSLGTVRTENMQRLGDALGRPVDNLDRIAKRTPLGRVLEPADVASSIVAVALDMPGLTGAEVILDNGQVLIR